MTLEPRDYQVRAIAEARAKFAAGARSVAIVSPTGSGKTYMMALIAQGHLARRESNRVVWLAHRQELLEQAAGTLRGLGLDVGLRGCSRGARVQVESIQTILARGTAPEGTLLIPDECHHFAESNRCGEVVKLYPLVLGATATPERGDGKPLRPPFTELVVAAQIADLVAAGYLVPLKIKCPEGKVGKKKIAQRPVDAYLTHTPGQRAICFAPNLTAAEAYRVDFADAGVRVRVVTGTTGRDEREAMLAMHRGGELDVLVNCGVLTEGYDDPAVSSVIVARGCGSQGLWLQMTGRALRPFPGKTHATLIDLRGLTHDLGRPDAPRTFSLDGDPITLGNGRTRAGAERLCRVCHAPLGDMVRCPECGNVAALVPTVSGVELVDHEAIKADVKDALKPRRDALSLAGMIRKPGRSQSAAFALFRSIFKRMPDADCIRQAREYNRLLGVETARREEDAHRSAQG